MMITKEEFKKYERVRQSGVTNMFDVRRVESLSGLPRDKIIFIMKNYEKLMKSYPDVRGGKRRQREHVRTSKKGRKFVAGKKKIWNLRKIPAADLKITLDIEEDYDHDGNAVFGGDFDVWWVDSKNPQVMDGVTHYYEVRVAKGYLNPRTGKMIKLSMSNEFDTLSNKKYVKEKLENLQFDFMSREEGMIESKDYKTDFRRLYIG